jgi:hypothetical protein
VSPGAVARAVRGGIGRRRAVQTIVIALVLVVSTASSVLGLTLIVDSHATFDQAFPRSAARTWWRGSTPPARWERNSPQPPVFLR